MQIIHLWAGGARRSELKAVHLWVNCLFHGTSGQAEILSRCRLSHRLRAATCSEGSRPISAHTRTHPVKRPVQGSSALLGLTPALG